MHGTLNGCDTYLHPTYISAQCGGNFGHDIHTTDDREGSLYAMVLFQKVIDRVHSWRYNKSIATQSESMMGIVTKLNQLGNDVMERYPDLNKGGCCVYAAMIVAALKKHDITARGIVASYGARKPGWLTTDIATINKARKNIQKNTLQEWQENGISFAHVGVEFSINGVKKHYDSSGVRAAGRKLDDMPIYDGRLEYKELRAVAAKKDGWNTSFNRRDIPALRKLVKSRLSVDNAPG